MKILVRATNWLGDAVMGIPTLREIRRAFAGDEIVVLARPWVAELYAREDFCDRILPYESRGRHQGWRGKRLLATELRVEGFDQAILLQNAFDAALLAFAARIPRRIGYARDARSLLLTDAIPVPREGEIAAHQRFYYLELLRRAGLIEELPACADIRLDGVAQAAAAGRRGWAKRGLPEGPWIGVSAGAAYGSAKRWIPEHFARAARLTADALGARVALFGDPSEAELGRRIASQIGDGSYVLAGETTLGQFIELASTCSVFLTNDSGPMHVAAALGVPTAAVFGATDHVATGPSASWARVIREPVDCAPCLLRECPIDHRCMTRVTPERVAREALELVAAAKG